MPYPRTEPPPKFIPPIVEVFQSVEDSISTEQLTKGLASDQVLQILRPGLEELGFQVEKGKDRSDKIERPVFYGENGIPALRYQIDESSPFLGETLYGS